jgi:4-hydroxybutyryl-CoA dehydratase/vinylacetyl-CoA-Delta-isomerase
MVLRGMGLKTGKEYVESLKKFKPRIYINGRRVENLLENSVLKTIVKANARVYDLAHEEAYRELMTAYSKHVNDIVSRTVHICGSIEDLEKKNEMARLLASTLGTCNYRCTGCDALNTLASVTYEMDLKLGTSYHERFLNFLRKVQAEDLACTGGLTDVKGDRGKRPKDQDPDMYLRIVDKRDDGIIVRGAKICQSGAAAHETLILPGMTFRKGEEEYAVAFAVPNGAEGLT